MDFIICTEDVNRYGYRVLLSGARLENFRKNPVMLYNHDDWDDKPVGRWDNLRVENGKLIATAVFAEGDEDAQKVKNLAEQGVLSATSIGMMPITYSSDSSVLLPGQTRETVIEWELLEVSIVPIPANPHTVKLKLSSSASDQEGILPKEITKTQPEMNLADIATKLGLSADATGEQILAAVSAIQEENQGLILSLGEQRGVVKEDNRPIWAQLAAKDPKNTLALIQSMTPAAGPDDDEDDETEKPERPDASAQSAGDTVTLEKIFSLVQKNGGQKTDEDNPDKWDFDTWSKRNPEGLLKLKREHPEKYSGLAKAYTTKK